MARGYDSYLLRCWRLQDGTRRIAVEHVQSGERAVLASLKAAADWIDERSGAAPPEVGGCTVDDAR